MTDRHTVSATTQIASPPFTIQVTASCSGAEDMKYQLAVFDADGQPAPLQTEITMKDGIREHASFNLRLDDAPAESAVEYEMRYNNTVRFENSISKDGRLAERAAHAHRVTVRLPLLNGEPVIQIDQDARQIRAMLEQCTRGVSAARSGRLADAAAHRASCPERVAKAKADTAAHVADLKREGKYVPGWLDNGDDNRFDRYGNIWETCDVDGKADEP